MLNKIKRAAALLLAVASALSFSGCSFGSSLEALLKAPTLNSDQEELYNALTYYTGEDISLVYPKSGEYRSAYVYYDLDGDNSDEVIVFYEQASTLTDTTEASIRVNIIDKDDSGQWRSYYDHAGVGTDIEKVFFTNFGTDTTYMIIGYSYLSSSEKTLRVYSYSGGLMTQEYSASYYKTLLADLNRDSLEDLIVINSNTESHNASVQLIGVSDGEVNLFAETELNSDVVDLPNVLLGYIGENGNYIQAVFIDGLLSSGYLNTEILYYVDGVLRNPSNIDGSEILEKTIRSSGLYSMDMDGDGIVEIPSSEDFLGYDDSTGSENVTLWNVFENYDIVQKYYTLTSVTDSYIFIFPTRWEGQVTVKTDETTGEKVFYKFNSSLKESRLELMRIRVVDSSDEEDYIKRGYFTAVANDDYCYMVCLGDTDDNLLLTSAEIINSFYLF